MKKIIAFAALTLVLAVGASAVMIIHHSRRWRATAITAELRRVMSR
jgi:hypothetical protein